MDPRIQDGYRRNLEFVRAALDDSRPARSDWRAAVHDVVEEIERIVDRNAHPDDAMHGRLAIAALVGIWLSADEGEALWWGER